MLFEEFESLPFDEMSLTCTASMYEMLMGNSEALWSIAPRYPNQGDLSDDLNDKTGSIAIAERNRLRRQDGTPEEPHEPSAVPVVRDAGEGECPSVRAYRWKMINDNPSDGGKLWRCSRSPLGTMEHIQPLITFAWAGEGRSCEFHKTESLPIAHSCPAVLSKRPKVQEARRYVRDEPDPGTQLQPAVSRLGHWFRNCLTLAG